jgi:fibronectin-binding autotransporter adhesin
VSGNALFVSSDGSLGAVPASLDPVNITLENGGVLVNNSTVLALDANRGIRIGPGGGGVAAGFNQNITFNGPISGGADDTVTIITNNGTVIWNADNTFAGRLVVQGEAGRLQVGSGGTTGTLGTGPVEIGAGGQITFNRAGEILVPNVISGGGNILKDGSGTVTLAAANTFTGTTSVSAGTLLLGDGAALGSGGATITSGTLDLGGQTIINSVVVNGGTLTGGTIDTSQVTPTAGTITATLSGTGNLVKAGGGQLIIRGTQTYAGETIIQSGTIQLGGGANPSATRQLPIGTVVTVNSGATLQVSGLADDTTNNEIVGGLQGDGIVNSPNTATNARLTIRNDADFTFNGSITSATNRLLLFKEGTGTQTLTGASTTVGQWTITAGTLRIENNTALGATAGNTLIGNAAVLALAGGISSAEPLVLSGRDDAAAATRIANAGETNTLTGGVTLNAGGEHYGLRSDSGNLRVQGTIARGDATGARTLRLGGTAAGEIAGGINGAGFTLGLVKEDAGIWTIAGTSSHTGPTTVTAGTLLVNGSLANTSAVTVQAGVLGGSGSLGAPLAGAGLVSPGNSPGILTAPAVSPSAGTGYAFEFTSPGSPAYGSRTASINDVLRLTDLATPFTTALTSANVIDIYFDVATLTNGDTFRGGFYTDLGADFLSSIAAADYAYWVRGDGFGGDRSFGGQSYYSLASFTPGFSVTLSTVAESADFGSGTIDGQVLQLVIVPEPGSLALAGLALATLAAARTARRRITVVRPAVRYHGVFAPNHKLRRAITALAIGNVGKRRDAATGGYAVG